MIRHDTMQRACPNIDGLGITPYKEVELGIILLYRVELRTCSEFAGVPSEIPSAPKYRAV